MPRFLELFLWIVLAMLTVVLPNAFKEVSGGILLILAAYYLFVPKRTGIDRNFLLMWVASSVVTIGYLFIG